MAYKKRTIPSMTARNIHRRRQRQFRKMVRTHPVLQALLNEPEISKHFFDIQKVLVDVYLEGVNEGMRVAMEVTERVIKNDFKNTSQANEHR